MIYLDANIFYWYYGRDKLPLPSTKPTFNLKLLNDYLDDTLNKSLPASMLMEIIVHFRDYPNHLRRIISFIDEKRIKVYNNFNGCCFTSEELSLLMIITDSIALKNYSNQLLNRKIEIEVKHSYVFLHTLSLLYADYYVKLQNSLDNEKKDSIIKYIGKDLFREMKEKHLNELTNSLRNGYNNNKPQQFLKKAYIDMLVQNCIYIHMISDAVVESLNDSTDLYKVMCDSAKKARNDGLNDNQIMNIVSSALAKNSVFLKQAKDNISNIFIKKGYTKHQAEYIKILLDAWLDRGQKLRKNDIFDMLFVGSVDKIVFDEQKSIIIDQRSYLLSFDSAVSKFICQDKWNKKLLSRFSSNND